MIGANARLVRSPAIAAISMKDHEHNRLIDGTREGLRDEERTKTAGDKGNSSVKTVQ
jgi:hypothetical protein